MTFNHDIDSLSGALGVNKTGEDLAVQMAEMSRRFMESDNDKISNLAEMIHEELSYPEILMLATINTYEVIERSQTQSARDAIKKLSDLLNKLKHD